MGCDGGTIPKRDEMVRTKKKPEQVSKEVELLVKWLHCAISQEPIRMPIVACELGRLFNKESILEFLLDKSNQETASKFSYIKGLKDVKELQLTENPAYSVVAETTIAGEDRKIAQFICPVTGLEMNGRYKFCYLHGCGCVFAERALKEIKDGVCVKCGKSYESDDIIILNGTEEDIQKLKERMEQRALLAKEARKSKKGKGKSSASAASASANDEASETVKFSEAKPEGTGAPPAKRLKLSAAGCSDVVCNQVPSSRDSEKSNASRSKITSKATDAHSTANGQTNGEQEKKYKSIQHDPAASNAFKSLFTTHESVKNKPKAHWVTHNPQYY